MTKHIIIYPGRNAGREKGHEVETKKIRIQFELQLIKM